MNTILEAIKPKSDQLNADDLIGVSKTIKITGVKVISGEQPVIIEFENDSGKPWKPCKSMARVLVYLYGDDTNQWIGKYLKLYRDNNVTWAGVKVGGIRISHASHIKNAVAMPLTASKTVRKIYTVQILPESEYQSSPTMDPEKLAEYKTKITAATTEADLSKIGAEIAFIPGQYSQESITDLKRHYATRLKELRDNFPVSRKTPDQESDAEKIKRIASETNNHGDLYDLITVDYAEDIEKIKQENAQEYADLNIFLQARLSELESLL